MKRSQATVLVAACTLAVSFAASFSTVKSASARDCGRALVTDFRDGHVVCIHASEGPPPGVDVRRRYTTDELKERRFGRNKRAPQVAATDSTQASAASASTGISCIGDGVEGMRVQAIYARASNVSDRFFSVAGLIAQYAADADYAINISAGQSNVGRRIRFVTSSCDLDIAGVTLSTTGDDTFSAMRSELRAKGFNRNDRKYLVWMDASVGICGLGEMLIDDRATQDNANNRGPSYARVDTPCWNYAEAHELIHTLGGVQDSAPHSSSAGHCIDENDTMCYVDTSGNPMENDCPSFPSWQVDCRLDDYFNGAPDASNYLATHWNVADSVFLEGAAPPPAPPKISLSAPSSFYAGNTAGVRAYVTVPAGRTYTVTWSSSRSDCKFYNSSGTSNTFYCPITAASGGQITATVTDSLGMKNSDTQDFRLSVPSRGRTTVVTVRLSRTSISGGTRITLTGKLLDASTRKGIIGMPVAIYYRRSSSGSWIRLTSRTTGRSATFTYTVRPSSTRYYMLVSYSTRTWASDRSSSVRLSVS
jgi:hypothetical protein